VDKHQGTHEDAEKESHHRATQTEDIGLEKVLEVLLLLERLNKEDQGPHTLHELKVNESKEASFVPLANAVADPGTVVVVGSYTHLAAVAVLSPQRLLDLAHSAVLLLDMEHVPFLLLILMLFAIFMARLVRRV